MLDFPTRYPYNPVKSNSQIFYSIYALSLSIKET